MKVILLRDVARLGRKGDIKDVPDGHAQNFLLPRKMAEAATPENIKRVASLRESREHNAAESDARFAEFLVRANAAPLTLTFPANEQGHLFKGLRAEDIARELSREMDIPLRAEAVLLSRPLKEIGAHDIELMQGARRGVVRINIERA